METFVDEVESVKATTHFMALIAVIANVLKCLFMMGIIIDWVWALNHTNLYMHTKAETLFYDNYPIRAK